MSPAIRYRSLPVTENDTEADETSGSVNGPAGPGGNAGHEHS